MKSMVFAGQLMHTIDGKLVCVAVESCRECGASYDGATDAKLLFGFSLVEIPPIVTKLRLVQSGIFSTTDSHGAIALSEYLSPSLSAEQSCDYCTLGQQS